MHSQKRAIKLQQTSYQQADIRMCSFGLQQLIDHTFVASCQQTCCKLIVKTCPQATDLIQLDHDGIDKFVGAF